MLGPGVAVVDDYVARVEEFVEGRGLAVGGVDGEEEGEDSSEEFEDADVAFETLRGLLVGAYGGEGGYD